jgi:hypothetical protein
MSILLNGYEQLMGYISQVEQMMVKVQGLQNVIEDLLPQSKLFDF